MENKLNSKAISINSLIVLFICLLFPVFIYAKSEISLPVYNPSFEDWNDSYPLSVQGYTTTVPSGWHLENTGYAPCDAVVKSHTRYSARTGEYAAFFDSRSFSNSIISDEYNLTEGTYNFNVHAANIGYVGTVINLQVEGTVTKNVKFNVTNNNGVYTNYSLSFNMETSGAVKFKIDNSKEWNGNSKTSHFAIDDWSLTTSDGELIGIDSPNVYTDGNFSYYLYNNGEAELSIVNNKDIAGTVEIPEMISANNKSYVVRSIAPYAFKNCTLISRVVLPKRMYTIGEAAFESCTSLQSIVLPTYLKTIGQNAFAECSNLNQVIVLAKSEPAISNGAFPENAILYVPSPKIYQSLHTKVLGLGFLNTELHYTGNIPSINVECPDGISYSSLDKSNLGYNAGTYTLNATFSGYGMSVDGNFDVTINKAPLSIKAPSLDREYGDDNPIINLIYDGFVNNESELDLSRKPQVTVNASPKSDIGNYDIVISSAVSPNYEISYVKGTLNVTPANLSIAVDNSTREYGVDNPKFTLKYTGLKNQEVEPKWDVSPTFSTDATIESNVGIYQITVSCEPYNYDIISIENGTLTITKAPMTLVATDKSRLYFEDNPSFDYTLLGLKNSDTESVLTIQPSFKCMAVKTSNVGDYDIEPLNADAQNYAIDYQKGVLSINKRLLTASIGNYTKIYGTENPRFEIDYSGFVNNEEESVLTHVPDIVCSAGQLSDVGCYPISLNGGEALNYIIDEYNSGTLTIEKASQTLVWNQDLSNIPMYSQVALEATSTAGLPVSYEMSANNVATLYNNNGTYYLDCFGNGAVNIRAVQNGDKNHNAASILSKILVVTGNGGEPSSPQIFLNVENAGTLPSLIAENRKYQIKNLRLTGCLNGTDINFLREMAGCDSYGNGTPGVLETLDISECTIVSGGRSYYGSYQTSYNRVSDYMFYNCKQLVNLLLPNSVTAIDNYALADCERLSVVSIPDGVESFGKWSFRNDISLHRIPMPNNLTSIGDYAFKGCNGISEITIPASVNYIGTGIVVDCQNIEKINVAEGNNYFISERGVLYTSSFDELLIYPVNFESNSYAVKDGVIKIAPYAFVNSKKLNEVILPSSLSSIGTDTFIGCVNLSSLRVKALTPPVCDNDCFEAVSKTRCELNVPMGCYSYYWVAPVWSDFNTIKESDFSGIDDIAFKNIEIIIENRHIIINGAPENILISIFQADGILVYQAQTDGSSLNYHPAHTGAYIVVIANKAYKLMMR